MIRTYNKFLNAVLVLLLAFVFAGCQKSADVASAGAPAPTAADTQLPPNHPPLPPADNAVPPDHPPMGQSLPHPVSGSQAKVVVPPEVAAKWKSVQLAVTAGGAEQRLAVAVGKSRPITGTDLTVDVVAYLPSFKMNGDVATSSSVSEDNPAALVRINSPGGKPAEGWVFQKLPDFNTLKDDRVKVKLIAASTAAS